MLEINRRSLITGLVSFIAAPAIVRVSSIMPVKLIDLIDPNGNTAPSVNLLASIASTKFIHVPSRLLVVDFTTLAIS